MQLSVCSVRMSCIHNIKECHGMTITPVCQATNKDEETPASLASHEVMKSLQAAAAGQDDMEL